ncbi:hypothetical protein G5V59_12765 [Nocardioides sp. W3-2-3]|nr:hypothetical protein [Nocardioides convexus]
MAFAGGDRDEARRLFQAGVHALSGAGSDRGAAQALVRARRPAGRGRGPRRRRAGLPQRRGFDWTSACRSAPVRHCTRADATTPSRRRAAGIEPAALSRPAAFSNRRTGRPRSSRQRNRPRQKPAL